MVLMLSTPVLEVLVGMAEGLDVHQALKRIGAIIERPNFYPYMTAAKNLKLVCRIKTMSL